MELSQKGSKTEKQWRVWSLSLMCGTQAHKTFYLVESFYNHLHHFSCMLQNALKYFLMVSLLKPEQY